MKKNSFIKSTLILIIGGFITKILGMIIKIITARSLTLEGIGLYSLILPTFSLLITLSQLGFPIAISKLVAENKKNNKKLVFSLIPISLLLNTIIIILLIIFAGFISNNLLHDRRSYYSLIAIGLVLPFTSISSIIRSIFFGKSQMVPHIISNIVEDIIRLITIIIGVPIFMKNGLEYAVCFLVISNIISELFSILVLILFLPKKFKIKKKDLIPNKSYIRDAINIGIPNTTGKIIGSIGYFLEPIILTSTLLRNGYSNSFIINEYGIISGYSLPILLLPSFFTLAISQALLPVISKNYSIKNYKTVKVKIKQAILFCLLIGVPSTILFILIPNVFLKIIYKTTKGIKYIRFLAPFCLLQYIQAPLAFSLEAMGKSKQGMYSSLISTIIRSVLLFLLSYLKIGLYSLLISTSINIIIVTFMQYNYVKKALNTV